MEYVDLKELALKKVRITGDIIGKFGTFEIEQIYKNTTKNILEVGYTFPIVDTATVVGFEVKVEEKILRGKCKEKSAAKKEYQRNIVKGNSAYMMEQETDNIFKISIGKIDIEEEVKITIKYIDKFEIVDNTIEVLMPTLVTPKYKSRITSNLIYGKVDYTVDFKINISKAINRKSICCPSHKINITDEKNNEIIEVINYDLSKDFKLNIKLKNELSSNAIISKTGDNKNMLYLSFMPEIVDSYEDSEKEYIFIVDVSGSMEGEKLEETKRAVIECLKQLDEGDKFNIIPFESTFRAMNIESIEYNDKNLRKAIHYINSLEADGGTEILAPIKFALYENDIEKVILLFTDGQVGNEDTIIQYVDYRINKSRIFPFGIDTNVNSSFIKQLAKVGNGKAELIQPKEKIDEKIIRTFSRIQTPLLENIEIDYGINKVIDEIREDNCLFNYEFFNVFAKIEELRDDIKLRGKILNNEYVWKIKREDIIKTNVDVELLFAKQEMDRLEEYIGNTYDYDKINNYKKMIIELSEKYNINSKYTSFITIYERNNKLFEVPEYQETVLSDKFSPIFSHEKRMIMSADISSFANDLDIPCFLRKRPTNDNSIDDKVKKTIDDLLKEKVQECYEKFIKHDEKEILTYILFALYYSNDKFNINKFVEYILKHNIETQSNELYMKLICLYYKQNKERDEIQVDELLDVIDNKYKKVIFTDVKIDINLKIISQKEAEKFIKNNRVEEKINDVLWYLYSKTVF